MRTRDRRPPYLHRIVPMRVCARSAQSDRPSRLAAYSKQDRTEQHRTEAILEKYNILEPVSVGGWTKIRLRRITRSSTCVCLRIRNYFCFAPLPTLELRARGSCCTCCTLALRARSRAPRSRGSAAPPRLRAVRCAHADPITCAH
jgi:hypothetical protein